MHSTLGNSRHMGKADVFRTVSHNVVYLISIHDLCFIIIQGGGLQLEANAKKTIDWLAIAKINTYFFKENKRYEEKIYFAS